MTRLRVLLSRVGEPLLRRKRERDLAEEIEAHLVLLTEEHLLLAVSSVACWVPARRATRLDPVSALRHE